MVSVQIRASIESDLEFFYLYQLDPIANHMLAFSKPERKDRKVFFEHWNKIMIDPATVNRTILCDGKIAGHVVCFHRDGKRQVGYWIGREFWGRGVATEALRQLLEIVQERPLYAGAAKDNQGSMSVLKKNGFREYQTVRVYAEARGEEIDEALFVLE